MPQMVKIELNPDFKSDDAKIQAAYNDLKKSKPPTLEVSYLTAKENVALSGGMYRIAADRPKGVKANPRALEDMDSEELKLILVSMGIKTQKQMRRDDVIRLVSKKMDEIEIV